MKKLNLLVLLLFLILTTKSNGQFHYELDYVTSQDNVIDPAISTFNSITTCPGTYVKFEPVSNYYISNYYEDIKTQKTNDLLINNPNATNISFSENPIYHVKVVYDNLNQLDIIGELKLDWINGINGQETEYAPFETASWNSVDFPTKTLDINDDPYFPDLSITLYNNINLCGNNNLTLTYEQNGTIYPGDILVQLVFEYDYSYKIDDLLYDFQNENTTLDLKFSNDIPGRDKITFIPNNHGISINNPPTMAPCYKNENITLHASINSCMSTLNSQSVLWEIIQGDASISSPTSLNPVLNVVKGSDDIIVRLTSTIGSSWLNCNTYVTSFPIIRGAISAIFVDQNGGSPDGSQCLNIREGYSLVYQFNNGSNYSNIPVGDESYFSNMLINNPVNLMIGENRGDIIFTAIANGNYIINYVISAEGCTDYTLPYPFSVGPPPEMENDCFEKHHGYGKAIITRPDNTGDLYRFQNVSSDYGNIIINSGTSIIAESNNFPWSIDFDIYEQCFDNTLQYKVTKHYPYYEQDCGISSPIKLLIVDSDKYSLVRAANKETNVSKQFNLNEEEIELYFQNKDLNNYTFTLIDISGNEFEYDINDYSIKPKMVESVLNLKTFINQKSNFINISFDLEKNSNVSIAIIDLSGRIVSNSSLGLLESGFNEYNLDINSLNGGIYLISITTNTIRVSKKININK